MSRALLIALLLLAIFPQAFSQSTKKFISADGVISFTYPKNWEASTGGGTLVTVRDTSFHMPDPRNYTAWVDNGVYNESEGKFDPEKFKAMLHRQVEAKGKSAKLITAETRNIGNYTGVYFEYTIQSFLKNFYAQWEILVGDTMYRMQFNEQEPDNLDPAIMKMGADMVKSLSINPIATQTTFTTSTKSNSQLANTTQQPSKSNAVNTSAKPSFQINNAWVTSGSDKDFKWYDWEKAPSDLKAAAKSINVYLNRQTNLFESVYDEATDNINSDCKVKIAAVDLDGDGVFGIATLSEGFNCCGTAGCTFQLFDNGGISFVNLGSIHGVSPAPKGVKADAEKFFPLVPYTHIQVDAAKARELFTYNAKKAVVAKSADATLTGGATPDALGKTLLRALQTNNKKLWMSCVHPSVGFDAPYNYPGARDRIEGTFDKARQYFEEHGVAKWNTIVPGVVTFNYADAGEKVINVQIEFYYQNKTLLFKLEAGTAVKYKGKFLFTEVPYLFETEWKR